MKKGKKIAKWLAAIVISPIALFLVLAILLYIPPVQNFIVHRVASALSESLGMHIRVDRVRLAFPLDLALHRVQAVERADTLLDMQRLRLHVRLLPLFEGRGDVDGFEIYGLKADTKGYIPDTRVRGTAGALTAAAHGIDWQREVVRLDRVRLADADLHVTLSDTAEKDTTPSTAAWQIAVARAEIVRSKVRLQLPGDSMRLFADVGEAALRGGLFDTGRGHYAVRAFVLRGSALHYDVPQAPRLRGLDPNHIALSRLAVRLDTLSYAADGTLRAGLRGLSLRERSGLALTRLSGNVYMDSARLQLPDLLLRTPHSRLDADLAFDFRAFEAGRGGHCRAVVDASIGRADLLTLAAGYVEPGLLRALPRQPLTLRGTLTGNTDRLQLSGLALRVPGVARLEARGQAADVLRDRRSGRFALSLRTQSLAAVRALLPASLRQTVNVPDGLSANGTVAFSGDRYETDLRLGCGRGTLAVKGRVNPLRESYDVSLRARQFPLGSFLPGQSLGAFSGSLRAAGSGFDVQSLRARLTAEARVDDFSYGGYDLGGLSLQASLRGGQAQARFAAANALARATGQFEGTLGRKGYDLALRADVESVDLRGLGATRDTLEVGTSLDLKASANASFSAYAVSGGLRGNRFTTPKMSTMAKDILFDFSTSPDTTTASVSAGDLRLRLGSKGDVPRLAAQLGEFGTELARQAGAYELDQETLKRYLPVMSFYLDAGRDNPLYNIARMRGYSFSTAFVNLNTDPRRGLTGDARLGALNVGAMLLDTIDTHILQDSTGVQLYGLVRNGKRNPNPLEVRLKSYVLKSGAGLELAYLDAEGEKGVDVGVRAEVVDSGLKIQIYPEHPVLAYRNFTVNRENFIFLGRDKSIRANVDLLADDGTGVQVYGEPKDSLNDLTVSLSRVNLGELSAVLPYLPQIGGTLNGDLHVMADTAGLNLSAMASIEANGFRYEDIALGDIGLDAIYLPKAGGEHHASAFVSSNGEEVLACNGTYSDRDGGAFEGNARLHDFPLQMLNGFLSGTDIALKGIAAGELDIRGAADKPVINGSLDLDSAHIFSDVYGFDFRTDERAVQVKDSRLILDNYNLYSTGKSPLVLDGFLDLSDFSRMQLDMLVKADNFELINSRKKAQSMVFGKVYANYIGTLRGTVDNLVSRGKLEILDRTDVTYILKDSPLSVEDRLHDLVEFTNFADTAASVPPKAVPEGGFDLTLGISVSDAAQFHCNLSEDGKSYVRLEGGGDLTLRMTQQGDMRMTGRFAANSGEMKFELPVIPLKTFQLVQGSSVEFTGDVTNPTLNIAAKERTKAVVTENDRQRSVAFDVGVNITKPLNEMGLEFTIEAPEDLNVQNQLAAMSAEQRAKAAVTLMATGMYMTDESTFSGGGFKANNALNAFLQSEIQNIAGSALKTIDINLGVENSTTETGAQTTDYSFQFAKRFWNNRFSVIVGGKVSTGAEATNSAESFIDNISLEYRLDQSATRYVKLFYDRDSQDPLEGQLTKTGAGVVLRRKTDRLGELFIFKKKKAKPQPEGAQPPADGE